MRHIGYSCFRKKSDFVIPDILGKPEPDLWGLFVWFFKKSVHMKYLTFIIIALWHKIWVIYLYIS